MIAVTKHLLSTGVKASWELEVRPGGSLEEPGSGRPAVPFHTLVCPLEHTPFSVLRLPSLFFFLDAGRVARATRMTRAHTHTVRRVHNAAGR